MNEHWNNPPKPGDTHQGSPLDYIKRLKNNLIIEPLVVDLASEVGCDDGGFDHFGFLDRARVVIEKHREALQEWLDATK